MTSSHDSSYDSSYDSIVRELQAFVEGATVGRDASHGVAHMRAVAERATHICREDYKSQHIILVLIAAWLHDVADHKYDADGQLEQKVKIFTYYLQPTHAGDILDAIANVSFSKEQKALEAGKLPGWQSISELARYIRHIVSDADKLEAIGRVGLERCALYSKSHQGITDSKALRQAVHAHADEKLLLIADNFMHTKTGQEIAQELAAEMKAVLDDDAKLDALIAAA